MTKSIQSIISTAVAEKMYELIADPEDTQKPEYLEDEEIIKRLQAIKLSLQNHEGTVQQNRDLQSRLSSREKELEKLKNAPFFPYIMNDGGRADFGAFYLISHAWFNITNFPILLGIVEIEWKDTGIRKMYLGAGSTNGKDFRQDVFGVALHGQKIKDSSED